MTIYGYLMKAVQDDARRAGERDRLVLEARRARRSRRRRPEMLAGAPPGMHPGESLRNRRWQEGDHSNEDTATTLHCSHMVWWLVAVGWRGRRLSARQ